MQEINEDTVGNESNLEDHQEGLTNIVSKFRKLINYFNFNLKLHTKVLSNSTVIDFDHIKINQKLKENINVSKDEIFFSNNLIPKELYNFENKNFTNTIIQEDNSEVIYSRS